MKLTAKLSRPIRDVGTIKRLLTGAEAEAHAQGESLAGAEHLLLAALELPDGTARRAFERVGAAPDDLRSAIATQHAEALRAIGIEPVSDELLDAELGTGAPAGTGPLRTGASAQTAFRAAVDLAKADGPSPLLGAHVVAAVAQIEHGTAARTLSGMGIDRDALATAAREELALRRT